MSTIEPPEPAQPGQVQPPHSTAHSPQILAVGVSHHSGPLPDPASLLRYGDVDPSFPERIMTMAEQNAATEREIRLLVARGNRNNDIAARWTALLFMVLLLGGTVLLALTGHDQVATTLGGGTMVAIVVTVLTRGRKPPVG